MKHRQPSEESICRELDRLGEPGPFDVREIVLARLVVAGRRNKFAAQAVEPHLPGTDEGKARLAAIVRALDIAAEVDKPELAAAKAQAGRGDGTTVTK